MFKLKNSFSMLVVMGTSLLSSISFAQTARIQIVHNSPVAPAVDIFVGAVKLVPNISFRQATAFVDAPAGQVLQVRIKPTSASNDTSNPVFFNRYVLSADEKYVLVANGLLTQMGYAANPNGRSTAFDVTVVTDARETSTNGNEAQFRVVHTATDAPDVDVNVLNGPTLVDNAAFRDFTPYLGVAGGTYVLQVTPGSGSPVVATFSVPLGGFVNNALTVLASGFLNPAANLNGPGFALLVVTPGGQTIVLNPLTTSRLQIVHNSASAPAVDIFVGATKLVPGLAFRNATPVIDVPANTELQVRIKPASASNDTAGPVFFRRYTLTAGESYLLAATGLLSTTGYAANPDARNIGFDLTVLTQQREASTEAGKSQFRVVHASTDAPGVDVKVSGGPTLVDNALYGDITPYLSVDPLEYTLDVTPAAGEPVVASFMVPLNAFPDSAITVFASGFLTPASNQNGPGFGLLAVTPKGQAIFLAPTAFLAGRQLNLPVRMFPVPANDQVSLTIGDSRSSLKAEILEMSGKTLISRNINAGGNTTISIPTADLNKGMYLVRISDNSGASITRKFVKE